MAIYVVKFARYPNEIKIGLSNKTNKRIEQHIKDHGKILLLEEYLTPCEKKDKVVERELLNTYRGCKVSEVNYSKTHRRGWTEFVPLTALDNIRLSLLSKGFILSNMVVSDYSSCSTDSPKHGHATQEVLRAMRVLSIVDSVLLTCDFMGKEVPDTLADFEQLCEDYGEPTEWLRDDMYLHLAKKLQPKWRYGVLQSPNQ
jgi:hypothetical protein